MCSASHVHYPDSTPHLPQHSILVSVALASEGRITLYNIQISFLQHYLKTVYVGVQNKSELIMYVYICVLYINTLNVESFQFIQFHTCLWRPAAFLFYLPLFNQLVQHN